MAAAKALGLDTERLELDDAAELLRQCESRFAISGAGALWERVTNPRTWFGDSEWRRISKIESKDIILLVDDARERFGLRLPDGSAVVRLLEECSLFVFYLTDDSISFLIASNDHDVLIAKGQGVETQLDG